MVPALTWLGHDVIAMPTVVLSNHPGHQHTAGRVITPGELTEILDALDGNGWLREADAVLSGYLPSVEHVAVATATVARLKSRSSRAIYVCDPVLGDDPFGLYVPATVAAGIAANLIPIADIATPNAFELGWLTKRSCNDPVETATAARQLGCPSVCATSVPLDTYRSANVLVTPDSDDVLPFERLDAVPHGTGDLFAGLIAGYLSGGDSIGRAVKTATADLARVVQRSAGSELLDIRPVLLDRQAMCR